MKKAKKYLENIYKFEKTRKKQVAASQVGLRNAVLSALFTTKVEKNFKLLSMVFPFDKIIIVF